MLQLSRFSTLLDIDKLTLYYNYASKHVVLVLCWILINLHKHLISYLLLHVLVLCWILINLHSRSTESAAGRF